MTLKEFFRDWLLVILWAGVIFFFSSQPYEKQELSPQIDSIISEKFIEEKFSNVKLNYASSEVSVSRLGSAKFVEFFIRKGAHFTEFAILALLIFRALRRKMTTYRKVVILSTVSSISYAILDEIHQSFTSNRTPLVHDVFIDSIGVFFGVLLALIIYRRRNKETKLSTRWN